MKSKYCIKKEKYEASKASLEDASESADADGISETAANTISTNTKVHSLQNSYKFCNLAGFFWKSIRQKFA
uniref:Uncharacterized protein n=1 Tax=Glossina brevipalpis TaxID=37001 RepID=A0A1A9WBA6_9MUSC